MNKESIVMPSILRIFCYRFCLLFIPLLLAELFIPLAHADGGAPQLAYVAGGAHGISIVDIAQRRVTRTITITGNPHAVLLSPDGYALYITQPETGQVTILIAKTGKPLCTVQLPGQPSLLALRLDATVLYVAGQGDTAVRALNPTTCAIQHTFETHEPVYGLAVAASTAANATPSTPNQLWISGSTSLTIFDVNGHLLGTMPVAGGPQNISIPGGFTAYVTTRQGSVVAVDLDKRQIIQTLLSHGQFGSMDYDEITGEIYVPDRQHNQLDVLAPVTPGATAVQPEPAHIFQLSGSPQSVAITSDGQFGFVALSNGQVLMLDIPARSPVASIAVGGTPHFIITGLYPPANSPTPAIQQTAPAVGKTSTLLLVISALLIATVVLGIAWFVWRRS